MSSVIRFFKEFRSVFDSEDLLKENEQHANIVTATTMFNLFVVCLLVWVLSFFSVFKISINTMNLVLICSTILLLIPAIISFVIRGKGKYTKQLLFTSFIIMLAATDCILKNFVTLLIVVPIILAARYYTKRFTIGIAAFTTIAFIISTSLSVNVGLQDLTSYNLVIPKGTTITINKDLREAVTKIDVDEGQRLKNVFIHLFLPKFFVFNIIVFACVQISQSGKKMVEKQKELSEEGARIESELNIATQIQKHMLPSTFPAFPQYKEFDIYANMTPAKEVGGDFYDMFLIDENHLAMIIADVSGKGVPAALIMMTARTLVKNTAMNNKEYSVADVFNSVNRTICDGNVLNHFITSWFGIIDLRIGKIEFVNAGHNPPLIYTKKSNKFEYLKTEPNLILGIMDDIKYKKHELVLETGDRLFLYTDGVTEATNEIDELYGEQRLINYLNSNIELDVTATIKGIKEDINKFVGNREQFDDITMLEFLLKEKKEN